LGGPVRGQEQTRKQGLGIPVRLARIGRGCVVALSDELPRRPKSATEIEAVATLAQTLMALERGERDLTDAQIVAIARAIDALELGAFETALTLVEELPAPGEAGDPRAHDVARTIALRKLRQHFLRLVAGSGPV